jgi:CheY-like chemotaxis protein
MAAVDRQTSSDRERPAGDGKSSGRAVSVRGVTPVQAASSAEALVWLDREQALDLAMLDMEMAGFDKLEFAQQLRKHSRYENLPIVGLISLGQRQMSNDIFAGFLTKPPKASQLYDILASILLRNAAKAPVKSGIDHEMGKRHPLRILLAEDNVVNQKVALRILERMAYRADIAANGLEVLEALERQSYDVVLMDMQMPEMDGMEATAQIRQRRPERDRPWIIALTANALAGDRERYLTAGMDDYVSKPVKIDELATVLSRCRPRADVAPDFLSKPSEAKHDGAP